MLCLHQEPEFDLNAVELEVIHQDSEVFAPCSDRSRQSMPRDQTVPLKGEATCTTAR
jgi:hypothetical protein